MPDMVSTATFQGIPLLTLRWRRSVGLSPEPGEATFDHQFLDKIKVFANPVPWVEAGFGQEFDQGIMAAAIIDKLRERPVQQAAKGKNALKGGLFQSGDLVLKTAGGPSPAVIEFRQVFVAPGAMSEEDDDLASARLHEDGTIRLSLTDIRNFYPTHGACFGRLNYHLRNGALDPTSTKKDGSLFTAREVFQYLFSQLPASPPVAFEIPGGSESLPPPSDILMEGEPAVQHLQMMLDKYGLVARLLPGGSYVVSPLLDNTSPYTPPAGTPIHYEVANCSLSMRPAGVMVVGAKRVRRVTLPYVPVIRAEDGRWYDLRGYLTDIGYSLAKFNAQILADPRKNFVNVPG